MTPLISKRLHRLRVQIMISATLLTLISVLPNFLWADSKNAEMGSIIIQLSGITNYEGKIRAALYVEDGYLSTDQFVDGEIGKPSSSNVTLVFSDIPYDTYAIALYQDNNENHKLDKSVLGIPKEPYAFSNNAKATLKAPSFKQTSFTHNRQNTVLAISL